MTENETKEFLECIVFEIPSVKTQKAILVAIQALEEIQQYRAIGTVEEFKALKEKSVAKKPLRVPTDDTCLYYESRCPSCGVWLSKEIKRTHCKCNQKLEWQ